ncbi:MAG: helix-turn-helix transcriptional regulator [Pyrinomonadaceae bacterium]
MYPAEAINEAMGRERLTNEKLADKAEIDPATVSKIRNGNPNVTLPTLKKVTDALGLELVIQFIRKDDRQVQEEEPATVTR